MARYKRHRRENTDFHRKAECVVDCGNDDDDDDAVVENTIVLGTIEQDIILTTCFDTVKQGCATHGSQASGGPGLKCCGPQKSQDFKQWWSPERWSRDLFLRVSVSKVSGLRHKSLIALRLWILQRYGIVKVL